MTKEKLWHFAGTAILVAIVKFLQQIIDDRQRKRFDKET